jgi:hypothetical protein
MVWEKPTQKSRRGKPDRIAAKVQISGSTLSSSIFIISPLVVPIIVMAFDVVVPVCACACSRPPSLIAPDVAILTTTNRIMAVATATPAISPFLVLRFTFLP